MTVEENLLNEGKLNSNLLPMSQKENSTENAIVLGCWNTAVAILNPVRQYGLEKKIF